jgi:hypothetical protein
VGGDVEVRKAVYPLRVQRLGERRGRLFKVQLVDPLAAFRQDVASRRAPARGESPDPERIAGIITSPAAQINE